MDKQNSKVLLYSLVVLVVIIGFTASCASDDDDCYYLNGEYICDNDTGSGASGYRGGGVGFGK